MAQYQVWVATDDDRPVALLTEFTHLKYARRVSGIGSITLEVPVGVDDPASQQADVDWWARLDFRLKVFRRNVAERMQQETMGFIREIVYTVKESGQEMVRVKAVSPTELLQRRVVYHHTGESGSHKSGTGDDVMKALVREHLGASAGTGRDLSSYGLSVAADTSEGPTVDMNFAGRNLYNCLQSIARATHQAGNEVLYEIADIGGSNLEFRTFVGQMGSAAAAAKKVFDPRLGNVRNVTVTRNYLKEENYVYSRGADRALVTISDDDRVGMSVFNRREGYADARGEGSPTDRARERLEKGQPKLRFRGRIEDTPTSRYRLDWDLGQVVTARHRFWTWDAMVRAISVAVSPGAENIVAWITGEA